MTLSDTPAATPAPSAHVLARELARRVVAEASDARSERVLVVGVGSGRNLAPFRDSHVAVTGVAVADLLEAASSGDTDEADFDGALSTHALLHGTAHDIESAVAAIGARLRPGAAFYATFGSTRDPRFGRGRRIEATTFAALDGPEAGVPHVYFDEPRLRALLRDFEIESLHEVAAAEHVGTWAHDAAGAATIVHWFVRATSPRARAD